ncbi:hypothetical protein ABZ345_06505 [Lentzea sp. NPDC005914]|uniref:hypothetical protein n=1 Tax=Lentzea sp. NPDC005914 TaxID=3154572 RepID=UPI0033C32362
MTSTPIFDALAEELDVTWRSSGEIPAQAGPDEQDEPRSGRLEPPLERPAAVRQTDQILPADTSASVTRDDL